MAGSSQRVEDALHGHDDGDECREAQVHPVLASEPGGGRPHTVQHLSTVRRIHALRHPSVRRPGGGRASSPRRTTPSVRTVEQRAVPLLLWRSRLVPGGHHVQSDSHRSPPRADVRRRARRHGGRRRGRLLDEPDVPRHARQRGAHPRGRRRRGGHHALRGSRPRPGGQGPRGRAGPGAGPDGLDDRAGLLPARSRRRDRRRSREPARCSPHPQHRGRVGVRGRVLPARAVAALPVPHRTASVPHAGAGPRVPGSPAAAAAVHLRPAGARARSTRTCPRGATTRSGSTPRPG